MGSLEICEIGFQKKLFESYAELHTKTIQIFMKEPKREIISKFRKSNHQEFFYFELKRGIDRNIFYFIRKKLSKVPRFLWMTNTPYFSKQLLLIHLYVNRTKKISLCHAVIKLIGKHKFYVRVAIRTQIDKILYVSNVK